MSNITQERMEIPGYSDYIITTDGIVYSKKYNRIKKMKHCYDNLGYGRIVLTMKGKQKTFLVHRLILLAFVGSCPDGMEGCHNDGNSGNCNLENLRWDTPKNNNADKIRHGTNNYARGENQGRAKLNELQVRIIRRLSGKVSLSKIAKIFGITKSGVQSIMTRNAWGWL